MGKFRTGGGRRHIASKDARLLWKQVKQMRRLLHG